MNLVISLTCSQLYSQLQGMSKGQDYILDCKYDPCGEGLLDLSADRLKEPMDQDDCIFLDEEEYLPPEPAEPPEPDADFGSMLACGDRNI